MTDSSFTGRARRQTSPFVHFADRLAGALITLGGFATILSVSMVFVFLAWVAAPLFLNSSIEKTSDYTIPGAEMAAAPIQSGMDEYRLMGWVFFQNGTVETFRLGTGKPIDKKSVVEPDKLSAWSFGGGDGIVVLGFRDGSVRLGKIGFGSDYLESSNLPENIRNLKRREVVEHEGGVLERTPEGQFRLQRLSVSLDDPIAMAQPAEVLLVDHSVLPSGPVIAALGGDGKLRIKRMRSRKNLLTGIVTTEVLGGDVEVPSYENGLLPKYLFLSGGAESACLIWEDGHLVRFDTRDIDNPVVAEQISLTKNKATITAARFLIGKTTLVIGDSLGRVRTWFRIKPETVGTVDGAILVKTRDLQGGGAAVTALAASSRSRMIAAGFADGAVRLFHVTSGQLLCETTKTDGAVRELAFAPKENGLLAMGERWVVEWDLQARHPEATFASLFRPIWYEGYEKPADVWQSSSGTDSFEPKYGLTPLVFGTLKATLYSMLFGLPLALLAAVYTSEFLSPRTKAKIKPTIELMASLPSVVLGFLAALVIAPFVENIVPQVLTAFATIPFALLLGAHLLQLMPHAELIRLSKFRFIATFGALAAGILMAAGMGPWVERWLFAGNIKAWADGQVGTGLGGWMFVLLPLSAVAVALVMGRYVSPGLRQFSRNWSRPRLVWVSMVKFLCGVAATIALALLISWLLSSAGFDPRGIYVGTYVQRNAMIVGFVMGFAVIPIIYTIAEDALSAVPEHLRAASLGAGATPWQTAVRIILPTAMSGLFSAAMVGHGRAVGETMIVLMAAGNTPVLDWNIFNGFRTLSANIAVELPEAVQNSTHFRTLFFAALTLFMMTFVLNTIAEIVRIRFRKRAYQL